MTLKSMKTAYFDCNCGERLCIYDGDPVICPKCKREWKHRFNIKYNPRCGNVISSWETMDLIGDKNGRER
jgi:hypothetical protein